jgi:hypothetical protein
MKPEEYIKRRQLAEEFRINFLGPVDSACWPDSHKKLFLDVRELGSYHYDGLSETVSIDSIDKPWRAQTKTRAERLAALASRCRSEGKNESSWRFSVETEVFHRFSIEVGW